MNSLPKHFQAILWSKKLSDIDLNKDKAYIVHQVLMYGSLEDIAYLKKIYALDEIRNVFTRYPIKTYTKEALNFIKNYILRLTTQVDESQYLKNTPRNIGS